MRIAEKTGRSHLAVESRKLEKNANRSNLTLKKQSRFEKKTDDFLKIQAALEKNQAIR